MTEPAYADGTPMPRCEYCGEFFTGYPGNQVCADCHEHIVEMEATIAQQRADIAALVNLIVSQYGWQCHPTKESTTSALEVKALYDVAQPIIERYRGNK